MNNIYPIFDKMLTRADKEALLGQRGLMVWFTGLSGSGKSTIAIALERELQKRGLLSANCKSAVCFAASWTETTSGAALIITWVSRPKTV